MRQSGTVRESTRVYRVGIRLGSITECSLGTVRGGYVCDSYLSPSAGSKSPVSPTA